MKRKQTPGERILAAGRCDDYEALQRRIDAAIRRAQAAAWEEGKVSGMELMAEDSDGVSINPYRKARRK